MYEVSSTVKWWSEFIFPWESKSEAEFLIKIEIFHTFSLHLINECIQAIRFMLARSSLSLLNTINSSLGLIYFYKIVKYLTVKAYWTTHIMNTLYKMLQSKIPEWNSLACIGLVFQWSYMTNVAKSSANHLSILQFVCESLGFRRCGSSTCLMVPTIQEENHLIYMRSTHHWYHRN